MCWMDLPVIDHLDKYHLLSIENTRACIDTNILYIEELMRNLSAVKEDKIIKKKIAMGKEK